MTDPAGSGGPRPGLVIDWKRAADGRWQALTAYVVDDLHGAVLVQAWVDGDLLRPV